MLFRAGISGRVDISVIQEQGFILPGMSAGPAIFRKISMSRKEKTPQTAE